MYIIRFVRFVVAIKKRNWSPFALILMSLFLYPYILLAQQSGNYQSIYIDAKTRSKDASGSSKFSDWKPYETRIIDNTKDFAPLKEANFNKYGSQLVKKYNASGFFRTEKIDGRWWIIDPEGYAGINVSVNSINKGKSQNNIKEFKGKFKNDEEWISNTQQQLLALGFNGIGSWSEHDLFIKENLKSSRPLTYTINWNFMSAYGKKRGGTYSVPGHTGYPGGVIFAFDPGFEAFCDEHAKQLSKYKNDPNLFGYFSDNEMPLNINNLKGYLDLKDKNDYGYLAAKKWIEEKGIDETQITKQHQEEFLAFVGERYLSIVAKAIKKYDPNHLYIGSRFYSGEKSVPAFMKVAGKYLDIISINYYGSWTPSKVNMSNWSKWSGKPFIVTEFYTKGMDSGLPNISGAGWQVKTQEDRGNFYQNFCMALLESKNCVGWHWFKYQDNDPTNGKAELSNTDANKGLFDNNYNIYLPLAEKMKQLNINRYELINYFDKLTK
ncbi:MAG: hypothetical protein REI64_13820 [Pedobacter sp.]|uniref:hypothetical protein n=1 Tax=Pedobacter sp. TaxID=1411316 RepID=UPI002807A38C|nr:hypothetical protein [Pedobacter sp.]MDQ8005875.1 hypothetical protein [Pedobacter sp.]